jgi:hypothetical protein
MAFALGIFALVMSSGTILAFSWTVLLLCRRTSVRELIAITALWALVVAGWINFIAMASR